MWAASDIAVVDDAQGCEQLLLRPGGAPAVKGQRGQRIDRGEVAEVAAEIAFHAPDGGDHLGRHAIALAGRLQRCSRFAQLGAALGDALGRYGAVQVLPGRAREFRLRAVQLHRAALQPGRLQCAAHGFLRDAGVQRLAREITLPRFEAGGLGLLGGIRRGGGFGLHGRGRRRGGGHGGRHRDRRRRRPGRATGQQHGGQGGGQGGTVERGGMASGGKGVGGGVCVRHPAIVSAAPRLGVQHGVSALGVRGRYAVRP